MRGRPSRSRKKEGALAFHLRYYRDLAKYSLFISALGGWFGTSLNRPFLEFFLLCFISVGFAGSIYFYHYFQRDEYYFYFNKGLSKSRLNIVASIANSMLCLILFFVSKGVHWL